MSIQNGTYTISNRETGEYKTFMIKVIKRNDPDHDLYRKQMIGILNGPDNYRNYKPFAWVDNDSVQIWKRYQDSDHTWYAKMIEAHFDGNENFNRKYQVAESRACSRCNRKLTTPESIRAGIGPECSKLG